MDLGKFDAIMPSKERVVTEDYNVGDRLRAYVMAVENGIRGPEIILSRSHPNFVRRLFELEVSEINDRTVEIRGLAREAGYRTKIAVHSANEKIDPVGACVGMRGSRVKNIVRELNNEKVDIIRWHAEPREFILEALKPARIKSLTLDAEKKSAVIRVDEDQLSLAIGKRGQNARLTAKLTGWEINIEKDESAAVAVQNKVTQAAGVLAANLGLDLAQGQTPRAKRLLQRRVVARSRTAGPGGHPFHRPGTGDRHPRAGQTRLIHCRQWTPPPCTPPAPPRPTFSTLPLFLIHAQPSRLL